MRIYCRLGDIMRARGITVLSLKRRAHVGADAIRQLMSNRWKGVRRETLCRIARALDLTSPEELFAFYRDDIFGPLWLHREVTIHLGSSALWPWQPGGRTRVSRARARQQVGRWDVRALVHLNHNLKKLVPAIDIEIAEHLGPDPAVTESAAQVFSAGNHIVLGSPLANQFAEEVVCRAFGVPPYSPDKRSAFPFAFKWRSPHAVDSSFGFQGIGNEFGIIALPGGRLVARYTHVASGQGEDCAIVMVHRLFRPPVMRTRGLDDEFIVVVVLGFSGVATLAAAQLVTADPVVAAALYPARGQTPRMGVVKVTYNRPPSAAADDDNRQIESAALVMVPDDPKVVTLPAPRAAAAGNTRRVRRG